MRLHPDLQPPLLLQSWAPPQGYQCPAILSHSSSAVLLLGSFPPQPHSSANDPLQPGLLAQPWAPPPPSPADAPPSWPAATPAIPALALLKPANYAQLSACPNMPLQHYAEPSRRPARDTPSSPDSRDSRAQAGEEHNSGDASFANILPPDRALPCLSHQTLPPLTQSVEGKAQLEHLAPNHPYCHSASKETEAPRGYGTLPRSQCKSMAGTNPDLPTRNPLTQQGQTRVPCSDH